MLPRKTREEVIFAKAVLHLFIQGQYLLPQLFLFLVLVLVSQVVQMWVAISHSNLSNIVGILTVT